MRFAVGLGTASPTQRATRRRRASEGRKRRARNRAKSSRDERDEAVVSRRQACLWGGGRGGEQEERGGGERVGKGRAGRSLRRAAPQAAAAAHAKPNVGLGSAWLGAARSTKIRERTENSLAKRALLIAHQGDWHRAAPGIEPGTSRTLSENHATRPSSQRNHH